MSPVAMGLLEGAVGANAEYEASGHISKFVLISLTALQVDPPITDQVTQKDGLPGWHNNKWERWEAKPNVWDPKSRALVDLLEPLGKITAVLRGPRGSREGQRLPYLLLCSSCHVPSLPGFLICKMGTMIASTSRGCCQE